MTKLCYETFLVAFVIVAVFEVFYEKKEENIKTTLYFAHLSTFLEPLAQIWSSMDPFSLPRGFFFVNCSVDFGCANEMAII